MTREWDAPTYDRVARPHHDWATTVLDRLDLLGDETVLDAGCGSGRLTEQLLARLPRGRVVALDGSARMLDEARRCLAGELDRVTFVHADLARPLPVEPVDAVVSSAAFHWIPDHGALFANLAAVLRSSGRLVAQCGGAGNVASVQRALDDLGYDGPDPWHFATPEDTEAALEGAGLVGGRAWLTPTRVVIPDGDLEPYLSSVMLGAHLEHVPEPEHDDFVRAVAERLRLREIDYVRLNLVARSPETGLDMRFERR